MKQRTCSVEGCGRAHNSNGFCRRHVYRWKKYGDPLAGQRVHGTSEEKFAFYADRSGGDRSCWPWTGKIHEYGYGLISIENGWQRAHRVAYEMFVGPIPDGTDLDHTCHQPEYCIGGVACPHRRCVNPKHVAPVANAENHRAERLSSHHRRKTHCPQGHEYTPENTKRLKSRPNARYCRKCHRADGQRRRAASKPTA